MCRDGQLIRLKESAVLAASAGEEEQLVERVLTDISKISDRGEEIRRTRRIKAIKDIATETVINLKELCASFANCGERILQAPEESQSVRRIAEDLCGVANRGVKRAAQFLSFAQKVDRDIEVLNVNQLLVDNETLLRSLVGADIDFKMTLSSGTGLISVDRQEMIQLLCRLAASSQEVLPLNGIVTVETSKIEIDTALINKPDIMRPGTYLLIAICADGCNVQPERRIASIKEMVDRIGGWLEVVNDPQAGNAFKVYLPRVEALMPILDPSSKTIIF